MNRHNLSPIVTFEMGIIINKNLRDYNVGMWL